MSARAREGFSLVELMVALVILTAGMLAMASASGFSSLSVQIAGNRTARAMAVSAEIEKIRSQAAASNWSSIATKTAASADTVDGFAIWYTVDRPSPHIMAITITSSGYGYVPRHGFRTVQETFTTKIVKPAS